MYLGKVVGRLVSSVYYEGLEGVALQLLQPLDEAGKDMGPVVVACAAIDSGPGDLVTWIDGREAALALPRETFVPVDATILGYVSQAAGPAGDLAKEPS